MSKVSMSAVEAAVKTAMLPFLEDKYGNPSSLHKLGGAARTAVDNARNQAAVLFGAQPFEIYFAPSAAVANNVAILGRARFVEANQTKSAQRKFIAGPAAGEGISACLLQLQSGGWQAETVEDYTSLPAGAAGDRDRPCTHFDASLLFTEHAAKLQLAAIPSDTLTCAGASLHPSLSIAALVVKRGINLMPVVFGGGQEFGLFPGTEPVAAIVGFGAAAEAWTLALS